MSIRKGKVIVATGGTSIKDQNNKRALKFWSGTIEEYNSLSNYDDSTIYNITNDDINEVATKIATSDSVGVVKPDGETIFVDEQGTLSTSKFTPIAPLAFETITVEGLYNVSYDKETREATTDKYIVSASNYSGIISYITGRGSMNNDGSLTCENYIDFPYTFGDILKIDRIDSYSILIMFGYYNDSNSFVPVTWTHPDGSERVVTESLRRFDTDYIVMPYINCSSVSSTVETSNTTRLYQLFKDENETFKYVFKKGTSSISQGGILSEYDSIVNKVNVVRIVISNGTVVLTLHSGNGTILNKFNSIDEITALPIVELKESSTGTILVDNSFGLSYNDLNNKPKVNGVEIKGDINISSLNVQDALTTKGPLKISKTGEWKAFNGSYNESTRQFELGGAYCTTGSQYNSWDLSKISTYASNKEVKPTAGVIMPFYKNSTYVPYSNDNIYLNYCTCFIGVWNGETFRPAYALTPTISATSIIRTVDDITETVNCQLKANSGQQATISKVTGYEDGLYPYPCIFIGYDNGAYIFKATAGTIGSRELRQYTPSEIDTEVLNECNAIWMIGTENCYNIGDGQASKLVQGDITEQLLMGKLDGTTFPSILPDNENYYTELSLNIDNETIKVNADGKLWADIQIPENIVTNEELQAKGYITLDDVQNKVNAEDVYTKTELDGKLAGAFHYKGNVENEQALPEQAEQGDVYNVLDTGANYAYTGSEWDKLSEVIDLSSVYTKEECDNKFTTLTEVNEQGFLIESDLSDYAKSSDIPTDFYTKQEVDTKIGNAIISGELDLSEYAKVQDVNNSLELKANVSDTYNKTEVDNLIGNIQLPQDVVTESTLESKGYLTQSDIQTELDSKQDKGDYALTSAIPTKVSQLTNDAGYITEQIDISGKADKSDSLSGYGIKDAYTKSEVDALIGDINSILDYILGV